MRANIEKYYLFLFVSLIPWLAMSGSVTGGSSCILTNNTMVTKIYFPRQVLPIATVTAAFINMLLSMVIVLVVCVITNGLNILVLWYLIPTILIECYVRNKQTRSYQCFLSCIRYDHAGTLQDLHRIDRFQHPVIGR